MTAIQYAPAYQELWQPEPPAAVFGELSADGESIVLVAQGNDFQLDLIGARLRRLTCDPSPVTENGQDTDAMVIPASWCSVVQLGFSFNGFPGFSWEPQPKLNEWIIAETIRRTSPVPPLPDDLLPPGLGRQPRQYQLDGAAQIAAEGRFLLLDEPGLGKGGTTLLGLEARRRAGHEIFPMIIVVPSWEVGQAWTDEIAAWELDWPGPVMYRGTDRLRLLRDAGVKILVVTYATLRRDAATVKGPLVKWGAAAVIADEFHLARNNQSLQSLALRRIAGRAPAFVALSGTGITYDTGDVQPVLEAGWPRDWPSKKRMTARYCEKIEGGYDEKIVGLNPAAAPEFFAIMDRNMRRAAKADVLPQLPPKIYSVRKPEIPPEWIKAYQGMEEDMLAELPDGGELPVMGTLLQMMRLSQLASSAADVEKTMEWDEKLLDYAPKYTVTLRAPSWKAESLLGIMAERPGQPVVCFTASRQLAMITGKYCEDAGYRTGYLVGVGGGITLKTRQAAMRGFQAGGLDVMVATAKTGGTGITLTRAGTVVFLQRDWALDTGTQPEDRAHRADELCMTHDRIEVIDVVAKGTVEDRVRTRLREKAGMLGEFVRDSRVARELLGGLK
jgi:SNF2 family DNA or RNA helicase